MSVKLAIFGRRITPMVISPSSFSSTAQKKSPRISPRAFVLNEHIQWISAETGTGFYAHVYSEFLLDEPFADSRKVVLVQERHII